MLRKELDTAQTIFALTTGAPPTAVAVLRLSGNEALSIAGRLTSSPLDRERSMKKQTLRDPDGNKIDEVIALTFISPNSFTGEDIVEFQCHGSVAVVERLQQLLLEFGARPAERGEFSYRAFLNNKLTAEQLETLGDVFDARQPADLTAIYARREGSLGAHIARLREYIIRVQAILETAVDFSEEYSHVLSLAKEPLDLAIRECSLTTQRYQSFKESASGPKIALAGRPNVGKSSLFNALLCRSRALVHEKPGTTRDVIEEIVCLGGYQCRLVDTAGIRSGASEMERAGIELGKEYLSASDVWVLVVDGTVGITEAEKNLLENTGGRPCFVFWNKSDLSEQKTPEPKVEALKGSATTGEGVSELWELLERAMRGKSSSLAPLPSRFQEAKLSQSLQWLNEMNKALGEELPPEFLSEKCRQIINSLDEVIGPVDTDEVLGRVFSEFCIGK